jgi:hypothetical protein
LAGEHSGQTFADLHYKVFQEFNIIDSVFGITADNAGTNNIMGQALSRKTGLNFNPDNQLFGCIAHVINLAAKNGLAVFGTHHSNDKEDKTISAPEAISMLIDEPDIAHIDISSILKRVHGLSLYVRSTDQHRMRFKQAVDIFQPGSTVFCLILDVNTRWNSTYAMFTRYLQLRYVYNMVLTYIILILLLII